MDLAKNPYSKTIFKKTSLSKLENAVMVPCNCKKTEALYDGSTPEYYSNFNKAAFRFHTHKTMRSLFWSVHFKDKHLVSIKNSE